MIPALESELNTKIETAEMPSKNYRVDYKERINGHCDELDAMKQTCYRILMTERYQYIIYDWNYGIELKDLFGQPISYVIPEITRRIQEALLADDRVESVDNFKYDTDKRHELAVTFTVHTKYGHFEMEKEIDV